MITIQISQIKEFFSRAKNIKTETLIPVLAFLKLECNAGAMTITKANQHSMVTHELDGDFPDQVILIEERSLGIVCDRAAGETIIVTKEGDKVTLKEGKYTQSFLTEAAETFSKIPDRTAPVAAALGKDVLQAIVSASKYISNGPLKSQYSFVYLQNSGVYATDRQIFYSKTFEQEFPSLILNPVMCSVLNGLNLVEVSIEPTKYIFSTGKTVYAFSKEEYNAPSFAKIIDAVVKQEGPGFKVEKSSLLTFCEKASKLAGGYIDTVSMEEAEGDELALNFSSEAAGASNNLNIQVEKSDPLVVPAGFRAAASLYIRALSALPGDQIECSINDLGHGNCLAISAEPNHISLIMCLTQA